LVPFTSWSCISADASFAVAIEAIIAYLFVRGAAPLNYAGVVSMAQESQSSWLKSITGGVIGAAALDLIKAYVEKAGGLDEVVKNFRDGGFKRQVDSWISTAKNEPISGIEIGQAIGIDKLKKLAESAGIDVTKARDLLAEYLPIAIDKVTPEGKLPPKDKA
jgi:uncharacterized protein YidB (DUF937 family)